MQILHQKALTLARSQTQVHLTVGVYSMNHCAAMLPRALNFALQLQWSQTVVSETTQPLLLEVICV